MFERDLDSVDVTDIARAIAAGGQQSVIFSVRFTFKSADGQPGGPTVECSSAIELDGSATFDETEARCLEKAMAMVRNLAGLDGESIAATIAADHADRSKTEEEQSAEFRDAIARALTSSRDESGDQ